MQEDYPLPEDYDLQSFRGLGSCLARYNYRLVARNPVTDQASQKLETASTIISLKIGQFHVPVHCL
jgi:hypothetical protein